MKTQPEPNPPGESVPPLLAGFLAERRDQITRRWIEAVRRNDSLEAAKQANDVELADHLPKLFDDLAATLRGESVDKEAKRDAEAHGEHRWRQHYELEEVLEELGIVSRVLLAHGLDAFVDEHPDTPKEQRRGARERIMRFFEDTAAGSVRHYVERTSQQRRAQDLLLSEQRRLALDSAQMGWWHLDVASGRVDMDARSRAIFDMEEASDPYPQIIQRMHPEDRSRVDAAVQAAIRLVDPVPYAVEFRVIHRDGSLRWVAAKGQTYYEGEGAERRAVGFSGTVLDITDEKTAHESLRESEAKYRSIFTSIDQGYCVIEVIFDEAHRPVDYLFVEVNPAFEKQTGLHGAVGKRIRELAPAHEADWFKIYGQVVTTGLPARFEAEAAALGRWYDVFASRVGQESEHRVAVAFTDITARRHSAKILRAEEEASRFLADLGEATRQTTDPDAVLGVVVDSLQKHLAADRCAYVEVEEDQETITIRYDRLNAASTNRSLAGQYRLEDFGQQMLPMLLAGKTVVITDFSTDPLFADAKEAMAAVGVMSLVNVPVTKAGRLVAILAVNEPHPRRWTADEITLIKVVAERSWSEVERSRTARALFESEARFRQLADAMPQIVWTGRPDGFIDYYNQGWYDYTGIARDHFGDTSWSEVMEPDDLAEFQKQWPQLLAAGVPWEREFCFRRAADGAYRSFLGRGVPIKDEKGKVLRWVGTSTDIHDYKELQGQNKTLLDSERAARTEAERISRVKDEFLATLSHELRTPLNAILGWTQVLRGDPANTEDMEAGLATIERNSRAQTQIIEDLLDMSKIISGKIRLNVERLDLAVVVEGAVETARPAAVAKGIRLHTTIDPQISTVSGDLNRLQQVFWNLLSNATKFTPKGGNVEVGLDRIESHLEVRVKDSGAGIEPEFLPEVFDKFRQQDASTTRQHGGLGLGLAIVKQLVELHGGDVRVESAGKGQGATFVVTLPLSVLQPTATTPEPSDHQGHRLAGAEASSLSIPAELFQLEGVKVLVVDDEADARALVKRLLEDRKAQVTTAGSAAEAMERFQAERPDVLVSDIGMPGEDGYALIKRIRALGPDGGGTTPAMALTAYARPEDRLKALMAGFQVHAAKPVDATELLALVATLAGRASGF